MQREVSPKPTAAMLATLGRLPPSALARSAIRPVIGSDCSQKYRKQRRWRSSRKASSDSATDEDADEGCGRSSCPRHAGNVMMHTSTARRAHARPHVILSEAKDLATASIDARSF